MKIALLNSHPQIKILRGLACSVFFLFFSLAGFGQNFEQSKQNQNNDALAENLNPNSYFWNANPEQSIPEPIGFIDFLAFCTPTATGCATHYITTVSTTGGTANINNPANNGQCITTFPGY